jgi:hypothetical protein
MQDHSAAVKSACELRAGALRLLLAEQTRELQQMEQQRTAALELAAAKVSVGPTLHNLCSYEPKGLVSQTL